MANAAHCIQETLLLKIADGCCGDCCLDSILVQLPLLLRYLLLLLKPHQQVCAVITAYMQMEDADPRTFGFLDLVALVMMQSGGRDRSLLKKKVAAAKHSLLHGKQDLREALKNCTSKLDIDM